jgi:hypothetical protein
MHGIDAQYMVHLGITHGASVFKLAVAMFIRSWLNRA